MAMKSVSIIEMAHRPPLNIFTRREELLSISVTYRISLEISPGLIRGERPFTSNKFDHIYKTIVLSEGHGLISGVSVNTRYALKMPNLIFL